MNVQGISHSGAAAPKISKAWKRLWCFASSVRLLASGKNGAQLAHGSWLWQHEHLQLLKASRAICLDPGSSFSIISSIIVLAQAAVVISISAIRVIHLHCHTCWNGLS